MYRKSLIVVLTLAGLSNHSAVCSAQNRTINKPSIPTTGATITATPSDPNDLRPVLAKMRAQNKLVRGKNLILDAKAQGNLPAFKLWATVARGKVTKWQAVDANGGNLPTTTRRLRVDSPEDTAKCRLCLDFPIPDVPPEEKRICFDIECKDRPALGLGVNIQ